MPALQNPRHEAFCQAYALSGNAAESWRQAGGTGKNADVMGGKWLRKVGMRERVQEIRDADAAGSEKSKKDIVRWLCSVVEGKKTVSAVQLKAAEILNRMHGWNEPDKTDTTVNLNAEDRVRRITNSPSAMTIIAQMFAAAPGGKEALRIALKEDAA